MNEHPNNEPGKSYQEDDRRKKAALMACRGLPTEWLERGLVQELYKQSAAILLADHMGHRVRGFITIPADWWVEFIRGSLDRLNEIATGESA